MSKKSVIRLVLLLICAGVLTYSIVGEGHSIYSFNENDPAVIGGDGFVETIEDGMLMRGDDGKVYDAESLIPEAAQADDCPT